jgi:hypothetical protein
MAAARVFRRGGCLCRVAPTASAAASGAPPTGVRTCAAGEGQGWARSRMARRARAASGRHASTRPASAATSPQKASERMGTRCPGRGSRPASHWNCSCRRRCAARRPPIRVHQVRPRAGPGPDTGRPGPRFPVGSAGPGRISDRLGSGSRPALLMRSRTGPGQCARMARARRQSGPGTGGRAGGHAALPDGGSRDAV